MAWHRGRFYVRKRWENGRCVSEYIGAGPLGQAAAEADEADRAERQAEARALREVRRREGALDARVRDVLASAGTLTRAVLLASGYHSHKGQWRRRRRRDQ